jgi:hypothetical protein
MPGFRCEPAASSSPEHGEPAPNDDGYWLCPLKQGPTGNGRALQGPLDKGKDVHIAQLKSQVRNLQKALAAQGIEKPYSEVLEMVSAMHGLTNWQTAQGLATDEPFPGLASLPYSEDSCADGTICWVRLTPRNGTAKEFPLQFFYRDNLAALDRQIAGVATSDDLIQLAEQNETPVFVWTDEYDDADRFMSDGLYVSDLRDAKQTSLGVWKLHDGRKLTFVFPATYPYPLSPELPDTPVDSKVSKTLDVSMQELVGPYERIERVTEWYWVADEASFGHCDNIYDGTYEFILNVPERKRMSQAELNDIPQKLRPVFERAWAENIRRLCFYHTD